MYLRTTRRKKKDGTFVVYYQLAHNERHPQTRKPVAHIIHSFGRADEVDRDDLVRLCKSIARVCNLEISDPLQEGEDRDTADKDELTLDEDITLIKTVE